VNVKKIFLLVTHRLLHKAKTRRHLYNENSAPKWNENKLREAEILTTLLTHRMHGMRYYESPGPGIKTIIMVHTLGGERLAVEFFLS